MEKLTPIITNINFFHLVASAVAQQVFTMAWFGGIVNYMDNYYLAADKGVRRPEHIIFRYAPILTSGVTLLCALLRSVAVVVLATLVKAQTLAEYQQIAMIVAVLGLTRIHRSFSRQRPMQLIAADTAHEVAAALIAAVSFFAVEKYKF